MPTIVIRPSGPGPRSLFAASLLPCPPPCTYALKSPPPPVSFENGIGDPSLYAHRSGDDAPHAIMCDRSSLTVRFCTRTACVPI